MTGSSFEIAPQVGGELRGRPVAALAIALQRLHGDPVQIPAQLLDQLLGLGAARGRDRARRFPGPR